MVDSFKSCFSASLLFRTRSLELRVAGQTIVHLEKFEKVENKFLSLNVASLDLADA